MATNAAREDPPRAAAGNDGPPAAPAVPRKLSDEFALIVREFDVETPTLREVMARLHGRGFLLLTMILTLPFCAPIAVPGMSTPFGLVIAIIGVRLALGAKPWLPARLLDTRLSSAVFVKVFAITRKLLLAFERLLRPRMAWLTASARLEQLHALPIVFCAALLLLPLPIPLTNTLPAWGILLLCAGLLERDGAFIVAGYVMSAVAAAYFAILAFTGVEVLDRFWKWLAG